MNYGLIAICDADYEYAHNLADFFRIKGGISSEIVVFTETESFVEYTAKHTINILLINENFLKGVKQSIRSDFFSNCCNVFTLCEQRQMPDNKIGTCIFKYMSAEDILREVMTNYKPLESGLFIPFHSKDESKLIGIYSPINRCGKTIFSLALALSYTQNNHCLFISFDNYSYLSSLHKSPGEKNRTIDDLLYYFVQTYELPENKLLSVIRHIQTLDFIPPSGQCCTFNELTSSERVQFVQSLLSLNRYDYIFMDLGNIAPAQPILEICHKVYMPILEQEPYSQNKHSTYLSSDNRIEPEPLCVPHIPFPNGGNFSNVHPHLPTDIMESTGHVSEFLYSLSSGDMSSFLSSLEPV